MSGETVPCSERPRARAGPRSTTAIGRPEGRWSDFAGWEMPVQYAGVIEEHRAVRTAAGLFDVSHMGEVRVRGAGAEAFLQRLTPNDVSKLAPGRAHYSGLLTERGTYVDDLLIYRLAAGGLPGGRQRLERGARLRMDRGIRRRVRMRTSRWSTRATTTPSSPSRGPRRSGSCAVA